MVHLKGRVVHNFYGIVVNFCLANPIACTFCIIKGTNRTWNLFIEIYIHEEEDKGLYVSMGIVGIESNGHEEGKGESMNLVETIKNLQRDVQRYKDDNDRLMKFNEPKYGFNIKLL